MAICIYCMLPFALACARLCQLSENFILYLVFDLKIETQWQFLMRVLWQCVYCECSVVYVRLVFCDLTVVLLDCAAQSMDPRLIIDTNRAMYIIQWSPLARCHGYHVIFRQSALSWGGGCAPPDPLLLDRRPKLSKTLDPKPLPYPKTKF